MTEDYSNWMAAIADELGQGIGDASPGERQRAREFLDSILAGPTVEPPDPSSGPNLDLPASVDVSNSRRLRLRFAVPDDLQEILSFYSRHRSRMNKPRPAEELFDAIVDRRLLLVEAMDVGKPQIAGVSGIFVPRRGFTEFGGTRVVRSGLRLQVLLYHASAERVACDPDLVGSAVYCWVRKENGASIRGVRRSGFYRLNAERDPSLFRRLCDLRGANPIELFTMDRSVLVGIGDKYRRVGSELTAVDRNGVAVAICLQHCDEVMTPSRRAS